MINLLWIIGTVAFICLAFCKIKDMIQAPKSNKNNIKPDENGIIWFNKPKTAEELERERYEQQRRNDYTMTESSYSCSPCNINYYD